MAPLAPLAIGLGVVGTGVAAIGAFEQGQAASDAAKGQQAIALYNQKVADQQATAQGQAAAVQQERAAEAADRLKGQQRAALGASGAVPSEGTPLMIQAQQAAQSDLDQLMMGYNADIQQQQTRSQAGMYGLQAGIYGQQASNAGMAGMIGAGSTLLTGFGNTAMQGYDLWQTMKPGKN
jgi:hypothetical protein